MKKTKAGCALAIALMLGGCGNAYADISHGNDVIATIGDVTITDGDLYPQMKESSGAEYTLTMIRQKIYEKEVEVSDEMREQAQEEYDSNASLAESYYGMTMDEYVVRLGYTGKEEYIEKVLLPNYEQIELNKKYFDDNNEQFLKDWQPVVARIFATSDQDKASQALELLKEGEDFESVTEEYGDTTTYTGSEKLYYTDSGLPSVVLNKLTSQDGEDTLISEVIVDATNGTYYIAYLVSDDYAMIKDEIIDALSENTNITTDALVYYLKKHHFTVYDTDVFNSIRTSYPQYLVQRPDISDTDSE